MRKAIRFKNTQAEPEAYFELISYMVLSLSLIWSKFFNNTYLFLFLNAENVCVY